MITALQFGFATIQRWQGLEAGNKVLMLLAVSYLMQKVEKSK